MTTTLMIERNKMVEMAKSMPTIGLRAAKIMTMTCSIGVTTLDLMESASCHFPVSISKLFRRHVGHNDSRENRKVSLSDTYSSCSNNGYMIKYTFFDAANRNQCHFNEIGTFIVSIAHYMRANFNHEALLYGTKYTLPSDAGYLNCVQLSETENTDTPLYAKIGCQDRETYTSTKLSLKVYTDAQCSELYDDGKTQRYHANKGYVVNGKLISSKVSFRPPFYKCEACSPSQISDTFNKLKVSWYDDDYINENGEKRDYDEDGDGNQEEQGDDQGNNNNANQDDYFNDDFHDDYFQANDDFNNQYYYAKDNGNRQLAATDGTVRSELQPSKPVAAEGQLEVRMESSHH